jgi:hypothetical protein
LCFCEKTVQVAVKLASGSLAERDAMNLFKLDDSYIVVLSPDLLLHQQAHYYLRPYQNCL